MVKKSLKKRIFFYNRLQKHRSQIHNNFKRKIGIRVRTIRFLTSGFSSKEQYVDAVSEGFNNLKEFQTKTGFTLYSNYKKRIVSGFSTKKAWEEANSKGFETRDEYNLAINEKFSDKEELVTKFTKAVEYQRNELRLIEDETISFQKLISTEYDKQKLAEYKKELVKRKEELEEKVEINEKLKIINHDDFALLLIIFEHKRIQLLEKITKLLAWIETRFPFLEKWNRILKVINSFRSHVPVQLDRIAELSDLPEQETEPILTEIMFEIPSLGEYLQLEQVFIKKIKSKRELTTLVEEMRNKQLVLESEKRETNCIYCSSRIEIDIENSISHCPKCKEIIPICTICRGFLFDKDNILVEENCGNLFHRRHIIEWVNVQGNCPVCRTRVNEKSLKKYEKN